MIFDRPTSVELVEAVSEFLLKEIKTNLPAHLAFKTQIAINVLNIVKREQENKELLTKESKEILLTLLSNPEEANINQLAAQIASGKLDLEDKKLQKFYAITLRYFTDLRNFTYLKEKQRNFATKTSFKLKKCVCVI